MFLLILTINLLNVHIVHTDATDGTYASSTTPATSRTSLTSSTAIASLTHEAELARIRRETDTSCHTVSGPDTGSPCVFPFTYNEETHTSCHGSAGQQLCATTVDKFGSMLKWGYCNRDCIPTITRPDLCTQELGLHLDLSCGYPDDVYQNDCDYTWQHKCGDVCIHWLKKCECGDRVVSIRYREGHCCVPPSSRAQCHLDEKYGHGVCPRGTAVGMGEPCNGQCYNQYSQELNTSSLSYRSQYRCDDGDCDQSARSLCAGYAWCGDKSDIRACNPELTCVSGVGLESTVSTIHSDLVDGHSFCIYSHKRNNGRYEAITREDEDNLNIVSTSAVSLDYGKLAHCNYSGADPGVKCGSRCIPNYGWCKLGISNQCDDGVQVFTTQHPGLCRNSTFWRQVSCTNYHSWGDIARHGLRCSGALQGCIYPWYLSGNHHYEAGFMVMSLIACHFICN